MIPSKRVLTLAAGLALALVLAAAPAQACNFCSAYGVKCYRTYEPGQQPDWLAGLFAPDGNYMGSLRVSGGLQGIACCAPADPAAAGTDWDAACNARYAECEGRCFSSL